MNVLQHEFGTLAREGETEVFLKEMDCALLTEATILVSLFIPYPTHLCVKHVLMKVIPLLNRLSNVTFPYMTCRARCK